MLSTTLKKSLAVVLSLVLVQTSLVHANVPPPNLTDDDVRQLAAQSAAQPPPTEQQLENLKEDVSTWSENKEDLAEKLLGLAQRLEEHANGVAAEHGRKFLNDLIDKGHYGVEDELTGIHMEYRVIKANGQVNYVPRFLINGKVYIIIDEQQIPRDTPHLRQYIARTHIESGELRPKLDANGQVEKNIFGNDKTESGRDLTILFLNKDVMQVQNLPKGRPTQWSWWKDYFISKYKHPSKKDATMALVMGAALQGVLTYGVVMAKCYFQGREFSLDPVYWNAGYGALIGVFYSFYKNLTVNSGSENARILKQQIFSTSHSIGFIVAMGGTLSAMTIVSAIGNGLMNNKAKNYWYEIPRIQEMTREKDTELFANNPKLNEYFGWKWSNVINQLFYMISYTISIISIAMIDSSLLKIPGTELTVPALQIAAVPIAIYIAKKYSRKRANDMKGKPFAEYRAKELEALANKHEEQFRELFRFHPSEWPMNVWRYSRGTVQGAWYSMKFVGRKAKEVAKNTADYCLMLLSPNGHIKK